MAAEAELKAAVGGAEAAVGRAEAAVGRAEAAVGRAEAAVERDHSLMPLYTSAQATLQSAHATLQSANGRLQSAQAALVDATRAMVRLEDSDVIKRKLEEMGVRMDSELKRLRTAASKTDYVAIGQEFQNRGDWVESTAIYDTFQMDVSSQVQRFLQRMESDVNEVESDGPNAVDGNAAEPGEPVVKRVKRELSEYSFSDTRLAQAEANQRNAEMGDQFKKYGRPKGEQVVQLAHGRVYRLAQEDEGMRYRGEDTHRRGVANASVRPDYAFFDALAAGRDFSVMVIPVEFKEDLDRLLAEAIGQLVCRLRDILDAQHLRRFAYGYIADAKRMMVLRLSRSESGAEHVCRTTWLKLDFSPSSPGLLMLFKLLYSPRELHGFVPPPSIQAFTTGDGRRVENLRHLAGQGLRDGSPRSGGAVIYQAKMEGQPVVVKVGPHLEREIQAMIQFGEIPGVVPLLAYGYREKVLEKQDYLITPSLTPLSLDLTPEFILDLLNQAGKTIRDLGKVGAFHGDISYGNIVYSKSTFQAYLIDLESASTPFLERSTGTQLFMSYGVLSGELRTVSMELESLFYVLIYMALKGQVPWKNTTSARHNAARKAECFLSCENFEKLVLKTCEDEGLGHVCSRLRSLFWQPQYRRDVTYKDFSECLHLI